MMSNPKEFSTNSSVFTPLAVPLRAFVDQSRADLSGTASSLLTPINYNADIFSQRAQIITGNYGFEGYLGIPGMTGTDQASQEIAADFNVAWQAIDPSLSGSQRAYTSAASTQSTSSVYGTDLLQADTMPIVFSHPILPTRLNNTDFRVRLSDGTLVTPQAAAFLPNLEFNERQTIVIAGEFGNRIAPGQPGSLAPVEVTVVNDGSPLELLGAEGPLSAIGLTIASSNPYITGNGPKLVAAKLNYFSDLGEGGPIGVSLASQNNSGKDLYGSSARYRLRLYTSAGFSPDGISSIFPYDFSKYFILEAITDSGQTIQITETNTPVSLGSLGSITVVGLADLAQAGATLDATYVEDHDNYYDIILDGNPEAIARLISVRMPSSGQYSPVYNPGGPGNAPDAPGAAPGPFTVASSDHTIAITNDLDGTAQVTFVEVNGSALRNPWSNQPIGTELGTAVTDIITNQVIRAYQDPQGLLFYASFAAAPDLATTLPKGRQVTEPIDLIDTTLQPGQSGFNAQGSFSRSAAFDSTLSFYIVLDNAGSVRDPLTGSIVRPGDSNYRSAALDSSNLLTSAGSSLEVENGGILPFSFNVEVGMRYAPVLAVHPTGEFYFAFAAANTDSSQHFTSFGANAWGIEDIKGLGDKDYDDLIVRFSIQSA